MQKTEKLKINEKALELLSERGDQTSLRHAVHLLTPARILAQTDNRDEITINDVEEASHLFLDSKESAHRLHKSGNKYLK